MTLLWRTRDVRAGQLTLPLGEGGVWRCSSTSRPAMGPTLARRLTSYGRALSLDTEGAGTRDVQQRVPAVAGNASLR